MEFLWYSLINGIYFFILFVWENLYWALGIATFLFLIWQENKVVEDEFVQDMRELL